MPTSRYGRAGTSSPRTLKLLFVGDSNTQGRMKLSAAQPVGGTTPTDGKQGLYVISPDKVWNGTAFVRNRMDSDYNVKTNMNRSTVVDYNTSPYGWPSWCGLVGQALRNRYPASVGEVRIANMALGGSLWPDWAGEQTKSLVFNATAATPPDVGDTVTLGAQTYTFVAAAANPNEVTIGADQSASMTNLYNAINANGAGGYGAGTTQNADWYASSVVTGATASCYVMAVLAGTAGDALTFTKTGTKLTIYDPWKNGRNIGYAFTNMQAVLSGGSGFGVPDVICAWCGVNDAVTQGFEARGSIAGIQGFLTQIHAAYPTSKVMLFRTPKTANATYDARIAAINAEYDAQLAANPSWIVAGPDLYTDLDSNLTNPGDANVIDGSAIHLSNYGYSLVVALLVEKLGVALNLT